MAMSQIHRLKNIQKIPASVEAAWAFFSDPAQLALITPPALQFRITEEIFGKEVYPGQVMSYTVRPLFGIPLSWMTEITHVEPFRMFVDEQRKGPYRLWHHQHHFKAIEGGVEMTDLVHYGLPFGLLGHVVHALVVRKKLQEIFHYRHDQIVERFGAWPGARMQLQID